MTPDLDLLKDVPLFHRLDDKERAALSASLQTVRRPAGTMLFHVGEPGDTLYVIREGRAEVFFKNNTGEEVILESAGPGDIIGELSLLDTGPRSASVRILADLEALCLSRDRLESFLQANPGAALNLLTAMGRRLRISAEKLRHTATRNVNEAVEDKRTAFEKAADWIAEFTGSMPFLALHVVWFGVWLTINSVKIPGIPQFDPFPFGFLTLTVSLEAIFLTVFVLISQNRQSAKDRVRADVEYDVNLKAELEIMHLHEKVDRMNSEVLERLQKIHRALPGER